MVEGRGRPPYLILGAHVRNSSGWPENSTGHGPSQRTSCQHSVIPGLLEVIEPQPGSSLLLGRQGFFEGARMNNLRLVALVLILKNGEMRLRAEWVKMTTDPLSWEMPRPP